MDLDTGMRSSDCPYTVHFYGAMFRDGDVMICMEVMDISLDKFYMRAFASHKRAPQNQLAIPESILGKIAYSVRRIFILFRFRGLCYMKFTSEPAFSVLLHWTVDPLKFWTFLTNETFYVKYYLWKHNNSTLKPLLATKLHEAFLNKKTDAKQDHFPMQMELGWCKIITFLVTP